MILNLAKVPLKRKKNLAKVKPKSEEASCSVLLMFGCARKQTGHASCLFLPVPRFSVSLSPEHKEPCINST